MRFTAAEGARRHGAIREELAAGGFDAYVVFTSENFLYTTNFFLDVATWERPVAAIFPRDGEPALILNELSINHFVMAVERGTCWVPDVTYYVEHPRLVARLHTRPEWDRLFAETLTRLNLHRGRIAVDAGGGVSAAARALLPDATFHARPELIRDLRLVKSAEELAILRGGAPATDAAMADYHALLWSGEYLIEVDFEVAKRLARRMAEQFPAEYFQVRVHALGGVDSAAPHEPGANSGRRIGRGDSIICNVILRINGYVIENERTFIVGPPSDDQRRYMDAMTRAQQAAIDAMVEGNRMADIDAAAQAVHEAAGTSRYLFHRTGHGIGIGGHEYPDDMPFNYRPLAAGMVWSCEPAVFVLGLGGFRHSDTVIVGREQPEVVTRYSKRLDDLSLPA